MNFQPVDRFPDVPIIRRVWADHEGRMRAFLQAQGEASLDDECQYTLMSGATGRSVFWYMLQHVTNHATYHRGQVTTILRQLGAAPPKPQDLIAFYRERVS
ncbi:MAG: hypothetical protein EXQ55_04165 [Acidobacteria bacterium]|nr:hypothetical protein [Acidobacteriota bacterium]